MRVRDRRSTTDQLSAIGGTTRTRNVDWPSTCGCGDRHVDDEQRIDPPERHEICFVPRNRTAKQALAGREIFGRAERRELATSMRSVVTRLVTVDGTYRA